MTTEDSAPGAGRSRRDLLRKAAAVAASSAVGVPLLSGRASASNVCPRTPAYWADNWHPHLGGNVTVAGVVMSKTAVQEFLAADPMGDTINLMARQYIATDVNLWLRMADDPECAYKPVEVEGLGRMTPVEVKNEAQHWLRDSEWDGTRHSGKEFWYVNYGASVDGRLLYDAMARFNAGGFEALDCGCEGVERTDTRPEPATDDSTEAVDLLRGDPRGRPLATRE